MATSQPLTALDGLQAQVSQLMTERTSTSKNIPSVSQEAVYGPRPSSDSNASKIQVLWLALTMIASEKTSLNAKLGALASIASLLFKTHDQVSHVLKGTQLTMRFVEHPRIRTSGEMTKPSDHDPAEHHTFHESFTAYADGIGMKNLAVSKNPDVLRDVVVQITHLLSKAFTNPEKALEHWDKQYSRLVDSGRASGDHRLATISAQALVMLFKDSLAARKLWAKVLVWAGELGTDGNDTTQALAKIAIFMEQIGLTGFYITLETVLSKEIVELSDPVYENDIRIMTNLLMKIRAKKNDAKIMHLCGDPDMMHFLPTKFKKLYSFSLGYKSTIDETFAGYQYNREQRNHAHYEAGEKAAARIMAKKEEAGDKKAFFGS